MSKIYEIMVFTSAKPEYARAVCSNLDPGRKIIKHILDRTHCMETKNGFFIKDLRVIENRNMKNMILVDNLAHSFGF